jgi:hypothetical protein
MASNPIDVTPRTRSRGAKRPAGSRASSRGPNWGRLVAEGRAARGAADAGRWRIGHLASLVAKQYGSRSLQAFADDIGESYGTVRRYRWVYARYEPTVRFRFQQLSFSHFQAVAGLPDRVGWLERAESGCWSVDELVRESRGSAGSASRRTSAAARQTALREARTALQRLATLRDRELSKASSWLEPMLDDLAEEIETLRDRLRSVNGVRLGRYRSTPGGNGHRGSGHNGNGNGHRARSGARD